MAARAEKIMTIVFKKPKNCENSYKFACLFRVTKQSSEKYGHKKYLCLAKYIYQFQSASTLDRSGQNTRKMTKKHEKLPNFRLKNS